MEAKANHRRRRIGHVGQAYLAARAAQTERTKETLKRIAEAQ